MSKSILIFSILIIGANCERFVLDSDFLVKQFFGGTPAAGTTGGSTSSGGGSPSPSPVATVPGPAPAPTPPTNPLCRNAATPCTAVPDCLAAASATCAVATPAPTCVNATPRPLPTACCILAADPACATIAAPAPIGSTPGTTAGVPFSPLSGSMSG